MDIIREYTFEQQNLRKHLLELIALEREEFQKRIQPYLDEIVKIESQATLKYILPISQIPY
jgi:hypothetical protein